MFSRKVLILGLLFIWPTIAEAITTTAAITGTSTTFTSGQDGVVILRSNSNAVMFDTLPGTSPGVLPSGTLIEVINDDSKALLQVKAGSGAALDGISTNFVLIGPKQGARFLSDGSNYRTLSREPRARVATTTFPPLPLPGALVPSYPTFYVDPATGLDTNSGIDSTVPFQSIQAAYDFVYRFIDLNGGGVRLKLADGTYNYGLVCSFSLPGFNTRGVPFVILDGNVSSPANVHISPTVPNSYDGPDAILVSSACYLYLRGLKLSAPNGGSALKSVFWGFATVWEGVQFGSVSGAHMKAEKGYINAAFPYTVLSGGASHVSVSQGGHFLKNSSATFNSSITFTDGVTKNSNGLIEWYGSTNGSSVTGVKAIVSDNGVTKGTSTMPGTSTVSPTTGGQNIP